MTVAYLCSGWPPNRVATGTTSYIHNLRGGLRSRGTTAYVLAQTIEGQATQDETVCGLPTLAQASILQRGPCWLAWWLADRWGGKDTIVRPRCIATSILREVRRLKQTVGLDLLEMEESHGWARWVAPQSPVPVVVRLHGPSFLIGPVSGNGRADDGRIRQEGIGIRRAHAISAPSHYTLEQTRGFYVLKNTLSQVIPGPIPLVAEGDRWRLEGCDQDRILFVGRFDRCKGGDVMVDAFCRLLKSAPEARLTFAGPDPGLCDEDGRRYHIADYIGKRLPQALGNRTIEWLGFQPQERLRALRQQALVTVVCSRFETFGYTAVEAMAQGCPVIASEVGGLAEVVRDGRNGLLCRAGDPADLAEKILTLLRDPGLAQQFGQQAAVDCAERYDPDMIAEKTIAFYRQVIERWKLRSRNSL